MIDRTAASWERRFAQEAESQFERERRDLLAILGKAKATIRRTKAAVSWAYIQEEWVAYLAGMSEEQWRRAFIPLLQGIIESQAKHLNLTFGMEWDVRNLFAEEWFFDYVLRFAHPIRETTSNALSGVLAQAMKEGWSIDRMSGRLNLMFQEWQKGDTTLEEWEWYEERKPQHRREAIARTETMRASNAGGHNLFKAWGAPRKEWLATADERTRDAHLRAWQDYSEGSTTGPGPIPMDEPFLVAGVQMMYPLDPIAPPELIVNCRCTELPHGMGEV